jgi:uncharacterized protein YegP (UPF0339 family)
MPGKYKLKKSRDGQFHFNLQAANNRVILTSERYKSRGSALNGIDSVKRNAPADKWFDRRTSTKGQPYFVLKAPNGEPIGRSEMYSSSSAMERGIKSVKKHGPGARLEDIS